MDMPCVPLLAGLRRRGAACCLLALMVLICGVQVLSKGCVDVDENGHIDLDDATIPKQAFGDCATLKSLTLEASVKTIEEGAFQNCMSSAFGD